MKSVGGARPGFGLAAGLWFHRHIVLFSHQTPVVKSQHGGSTIRLSRFFYVVRGHFSGWIPHRTYAETLSRQKQVRGYAEGVIRICPGQDLAVLGSVHVP